MKDIDSGNYFTSETYFSTAMQLKELSQSAPKHTIGEAFLLLMRDVPKEHLNNLISKIQEYYLSHEAKAINDEDCYRLTQGESIVNQVPMNSDTSKLLYHLAIECLQELKPLGDARTPDGRFNCSEWMGHCLLEGKLAGELAEALGLSFSLQEQATVNGIVHDIGRKQFQNWKHIITGCEYLMDQGWYSEAIACMTHSFLAGGRNCSNEKALPTFKLDEDGNEYVDADASKDDITLFLESYGKYDNLDLILNVADLMATSYAIVSPQDRIQDIAQRRQIDPTNRGYFLKKFTAILMTFGEKMGCQFDDLTDSIQNAEDNLEKIHDNFIAVSKRFYDQYQFMVQSHEVGSSQEKGDSLGDEI